MNFDFSPSAAHMRFATNKKVVTEHGAKIFDVSVERFSSWHWQMKHQVVSPEQLPKNMKITFEESSAFSLLKDKFHAGISPYSIALMDLCENDESLRRQLMPHIDELKDTIGVSDPLQEVNNSPVKELVHVYPHKVAWCVAQLCPVYCRYCFRKRRDEEVGLHFNKRIIAAGIEYIASNKNIRDVLITGGDPFIAHDSSIENLLRSLREIPHVDIIRFGTRTPVALPYRITENLAKILEKYHPIWVNTHFNSAAELTPEAAQAIDTLLKHGVPVGNQSVLLKGVNDSFEEMASLMQGLVRMRVRPYYIYHPQIVEGTAHLRVPVEKGLDIMRAMRGNLTGFAIPQYVLDTPSGKVPLSPQHVIGRRGDFFVVTQLNGLPWEEPNPLENYVSLNPVPVL